VRLLFPAEGCPDLATALVVVPTISCRRRPLIGALRSMTAWIIWGRRPRGWHHPGRALARGLRFKGPKSDMGKRTISLPASAVAMLRDHPLGLLELRLAIGRQQPDDDALLFPNDPEGSPIPPNRLTRRWQDACKALDLPRGWPPRAQAHARQHADRGRRRRRGYLSAPWPCQPVGDAQCLWPPFQEAR
jgi:hypothetical protein